jgi:hypothetical protein
MNITLDSSPPVDTQQLNVRPGIWSHLCGTAFTQQFPRMAPLPRQRAMFRRRGTAGIPRVDGPGLFGRMSLSHPSGCLPPFSPWGSCLQETAIRAGCSGPHHQERLGSAVIELLDLVSEWLWLSEWDGNVIADPGNGSRVVDNLRSHVVSPSPDGVLGCLCRCIVSGVYMTWLKPAWPDTVVYYAASWGGGFRPVEWGGQPATARAASPLDGGFTKTAREWNE